MFLLQRLYPALVHLAPAVRNHPAAPLPPPLHQVSSHLTHVLFIEARTPFNENRIFSLFYLRTFCLYFTDNSTDSVIQTQRQGLQSCTRSKRAISFSIFFFYYTFFLRKIKSTNYMNCLQMYEPPPPNPTIEQL